MNLLEAYLTNEEEAGDTFSTLNARVSYHMQLIKEEAQSFEYRCLVDEAFQHQIASLCLAVHTLKEQVTEAENGIERFVQNTYKKWTVYMELQQDMLRLLTTKTIEGMTRLHRLDRSSSFNVIKVNAHDIEISHFNKALVLPSPPPIPTAPVVVETPIITIELFQTAASIQLVKERAEYLMNRFAEIRRKIRVYQAHYDVLGNMSFLRTQHDQLKQKMDEVAYYVEQTVVMQCEDDTVIRREIKEINECFEKMRALLAKECEHCRAYMLNTITRFIECSTTYQRLITYLTAHKVELEQQPQQQDKEPIHCCSMYLQIDNTMS